MYKQQKGLWQRREKYRPQAENYEMKKLRNDRKQIDINLEENVKRKDKSSENHRVIIEKKIWENQS